MTGRAGPGRQIAFEFSQAPRYGREDLVVGASNSLALAFVDRWPDWPGPVLCIVGPPRAGKTHIAHIWAEIAGDVCIADPADLRPTVELLLRTGRPVLLDDADRVADEQALFHLINLVRERHMTMLMTARRRPTAWPVDLADLRSRLQGVSVAEFRQPDDPMFEELVARAFANRQLDVSRNVVHYLVRRIDRSYDAVDAVVAGLDKLALIERRSIDTAFVGRAMDRILAGRPDPFDAPAAHRTLRGTDGRDDADDEQVPRHRRAEDASPHD